MQDPSLNLKDELVFDRLAGFSLRTKHEALKKEVAEIETQIRQCTDCLDTLVRMQQRYARLMQISREQQPVLVIGHASECRRRPQCMAQVQWSRMTERMKSNLVKFEQLNFN